MVAQGGSGSPKAALCYWGIARRFVIVAEGGDGGTHLQIASCRVTAGLRWRFVADGGGVFWGIASRCVMVVSRWFLGSRLRLC